MKKIIFALASILMLTITACSSKADYATINEKIEKGQSLSQSDYSAMIDYLIDVNTAAEKVKSFEDMTELGKKYPYMVAFQAALMNADESKIGKDNIKKMAKLSDQGEKQWENLDEIEFPALEDE